MGLLDRIRPHPGWKDADPKVRRAAVRGLADPVLLSEIARADPEPRVREEAIDALLGLALQSADDAAALAALEPLADHRHLVSVARAAVSEAASRAALGRLADARAFGSVARHGAHPGVRLDALARIDDPGEILSVALKSAHADSALAALERIAGQADPAGALPAIQAVAQRARSLPAARRARGILHERRQAERQTGPAPTDRARQTHLCGQVEALAAHSEDCEQLASAIAAAQDAWTDLVPDIDDDLAERFAAACRAARDRLSMNEAARSERHRQEQERARFVAEHLAPRIALCEAVETSEEATIPRTLEDARWEWDRLLPFHTPETDSLQRRFEDACEAAASRQTARREEAERDRARAEETAAREAQEHASRDNAVRLEALCAGLEGLLAGDGLSLKEADPRLRAVRAALEDPGPLPSKRERNTLLRRLRDLHKALAPQVQDLREEDAWKRWANANVQEELCAEAEGLRRVPDPIVAVRRLNEITERWKAASSASRDRAEDLWSRFRIARDEVIVRLKAHRAAQAAARSAGRVEKEALCARAEALADSTDWAKTAAALREIQGLWKAAGPAPRRDETPLRDRFRSACDRFFRSRDAALAQRKEAWRKNLEAKEALCARVEALADSTDWAATAAEIKRLQAEWKTIGPVRHSRSEAVWKRFRTACDRFFERHKRRDAIDRETAAALREALCLEVEALAAPEGAPAPQAAPAPDLAGTVASVWARWQQAAPLPEPVLAPLRRRFDAALSAVLEARGAALRGTAFDIEANRRSLEDLCARAEGLLRAGGSPEVDGLTPVARLAALWREALATNTIGGKAAEETKRRAAAGELARIEALGRKVGYLPEAVRRPLQERLEAVARRLAPPPERPGPGRREQPRRDGGRPGGPRPEGGRRPGMKTGDPGRRPGRSAGER